MNNIYVYGELAKIVGQDCLKARITNAKELQTYLYQYGKPAVKKYLDDAMLFFGNDINRLQPVTAEIADIQFGDNDIHIIRNIEGEAPAIFPIIGGLVAGLSFKAIVINVLISLAMSAISKLLTSSPDSPEPNSNSVDNNPSTFFDGPVNQQVQGAPVPIVYGTCRCSSVVIAAQILTEQTSSPS